MNQFPEITISGAPFERGVQHGTQLRREIGETIAFYRSVFSLSEEQITERTSYFQAVIREFNQDYYDEIMGIASGANIDPLWIVALNSRTELLSSSHSTVSKECTSLFFSEQAILGQNWDWGKAIEPLTVLMKIIRPDGHTIRMLTEPGIIGKIGMNNHGLGVCLNILNNGKVLDGVPIHVILRAILDCQTLAEVNSLLTQHALGKASNVMVGDAKGNGFGLEFCSEKTYQLQGEPDYLLHTNHYLGEEINSPNNPDFNSSYARFTKATELLSACNQKGAHEMQAILSDDSNAALPIYRDYVPSKLLKEDGTIFTIVMKLAKQKMHIRKGKGMNANFFVYGVTD